eukprot:scaffold67700_cov63-Phaeocystis_antarctica.AAC.2
MHHPYSATPRYLSPHRSSCAGRCNVATRCCQRRAALSLSLRLSLSLPLTPTPNQVLPKSRSPQRLKENLDLGHLDLTAAEMEVIRGLDQVRRIGV